jgi:hypothetical protein
MSGVVIATPFALGVSRIESSQRKLRGAFQIYRKLISRGSDAVKLKPVINVECVGFSRFIGN